jgi:hypothetical protein
MAVLGHGLHQVGGDHLGGGYADEDVRADQRVGQRSLDHLAVGDLGHLFLDGVLASARPS